MLQLSAFSKFFLSEEDAVQKKCCNLTIIYPPPSLDMCFHYSLNLVFVGKCIIIIMVDKNTCKSLILILTAHMQPSQKWGLFNGNFLYDHLGNGRLFSSILPKKQRKWKSAITPPFL